MKTTIRTINAILAAALLVGAVSCRDNEISVPEGKEQTVRLDLIAPGAGTRAAGDLVADSEQERTVHRVNVFAFDHSDGTVSSSVSVSAGEVDDIMAIELRVPRKAVDIYVVANAPAGSLSSVRTLSELEQVSSQFIDNSASSFVMKGAAENIDPEARPSLSIQLERVASKVILKKVTKAFSSANLQSKDVRLKDVRLVNVTRNVVLCGEPDAAPAADDASYINPRSFVETGTGMVGAADLNYEVTAEGTELENGGIALYFYPNAAAESPSVEEEDYVTKLVLTVGVGDKDYYYPIGIVQNAGENGRNLIYEVENVMLTLLGNDPEVGPNPYINKKSAIVTLNVLDWDTLEVDPSYVNEQSVFKVDGIDAFVEASGTKTVKISSSMTDMIGRSSALGWAAQISLDGGVSWTTFPTWLTLSAYSGNGSLTEAETITLTYNKAGMGTVTPNKVVIRFVQDITGRIIVRYMKEEV